MGNRAHAVLPLAVLFLFSLLIRLPFFFPAVVNRDESTFILIGQSVVDGHLPYVKLWDVKPPLLFAFFAGTLGLLGRDIVAVRLAGALCVATTAFLVYLTARRWWTRPEALYAALLCIPGISLIDAGQATMSEHVMLPALMAALYLWTGTDESPRRYFLIGVCLAVATLVRLNSALVVVAVGVALAITAWRKWPGAHREAAAFVAGGCLIAALTCLPFAVAGHLTTLWQSSIVAALARSVSARAPLDNLVVHGMAALGIWRGSAGLNIEVPWFNAFVWVSAVAGLAAIGWRWHGLGRVERRGIGRLLVVAAATMAGIVLSGDAYRHYMIQMVPFAALLSGALAHALAGAGRRSVYALAAILAAASMTPVVSEYRGLIGRVRTGESVRYGPAVDLAAYLDRENPDGRPVYLLGDHLAYWLTRIDPPTPFAAHPSTISRDYLLRVLGTTAEAELGQIFRQAPEFVVIADNRTFVQGSWSKLLHAKLAADYVLVAEHDEREIYRRKPSAR